MPRLTFPDTAWPPRDVPDAAPLAEVLGAADSPLLFGCRTGLCGTCVVLVEPSAPIPAPDEDEAEILSLHAPGRPDARLACQLRLTVDCALRAP